MVDALNKMRSDEFPNGIGGGYDVLERVVREAIEAYKKRQADGVVASGQHDEYATAAFDALAEWKRKDAKKKVGLF